MTLKKLERPSVDAKFEAARGIFQFFKGKEKHINRLHQVFDEMPKGWQRKIGEALKITGIVFP